MKAFQVGPFGIDHLTLAERPQPTAKPGEVLLKMKAASLNYRDLMMVRGEYNPRQPLPLIPCSDGVGEIVALGKGTHKHQIGDRVLPLFAQGWIAGPPTKDRIQKTLGGPIDGVLCQYMAVPEENLVSAPTHLTDAEAATLPCAALTAWSALVTQGDVKPGQKVLILGTGGVATFALQFARLLGADVTVTSSQDSKLERAIALGAHRGINYCETPKWGKAVLELTGGVDHVIEVGGADTLSQSLRALLPGGTISLIGVLSGVVKNLNIIPILMQNLRVQGIFVGHRDSFEAMNRAISQSQLRPVVDRVFSFEDTPEAFRYLQSAQHLGKICIQIDPTDSL